MSISAPRDDNRVTVMLATLNSDGLTVGTVGVSAAHALSISDGTTGSSIASDNAQRDANGVPAIWGVSESDGTTPIPIYMNSSGQLLIDST